MACGWLAQVRRTIMAAMALFRMAPKAAPDAKAAGMTWCTIQGLRASDTRRAASKTLDTLSACALLGLLSLLLGFWGARTCHSFRSQAAGWLTQPSRASVPTKATILTLATPSPCGLGDADSLGMQECSTLQG